MSDTRTHPWSYDPRDPFLAALGLKELLETTPDLAFACDSEGNLLWASRVFESLAGQPVSELIGRPLLLLLSPPARRRTLRAIADQSRRHASWFEVTVLVADARGRESNVTARVVRRERPDGGIVFAGTAHEAQACSACEPAARDQVVTGASEVSSRAAAPTTCDETEAEPLQAVDVLATMNQEIRAPMNAMIGMARLLLQTNLDEEQQALVDLIWKSGQATLRLVNDAYEFTRVETGHLDLDHIAFDLRVTIDETVASLTPLAAEKGLELECRVHPAVPSRLRGDPGRLRQILLNLGERAIRALDEGRIELLVSRLRENDHGVTLRFLLMDQSAAADDAQQGSVVPPERREPGSTPGRESGGGLGLAVIRRLAELMGGRTGIECKPGEGHRYWFDVDLEKQEELESTAAPRLSKAALATKRALIVDSSAVVRRAVRSRLEGAGCRASEAGGAEEAHAVLRAAVESGDPFHFVLIDRDLPGIDGEELGAMIRADHALDVARTVMLATVGHRGDATRASARGFSAFLPKAVGVEELVDALCEIIRQAMVTPPGGTPELVTRYSLAEGRRSKTRVLLVDDDAVSQVVTQWCLSRLGYRLEIAGTLAEARAAWSNAAFDIVLVDEHLADGDALTLAHELREHEGEGRHAAIIAMFRDENSPARISWQESGAVDFVVKPVDLVVLTRLVERLTGTGLPSGSAIEDEYAGRPAGQPTLPTDGKLEFVLPDVDRILTESEVQATMASAMRASMTAGTCPAPAEPRMASHVTAPEVEPVDAAKETTPALAEVRSVDPAPMAEAVVVARVEALPRELDEAVPVMEAIAQEVALPSHEKVEAVEPVSVPVMEAIAQEVAPPSHEKVEAVEPVPVPVMEAIAEEVALPSHEKVEAVEPVSVPVMEAIAQEVAPPSHEKVEAVEPMPVPVMEAIAQEVAPPSHEKVEAVEPVSVPVMEAIAQEVAPPSHEKVEAVEPMPVPVMEAIAQEVAPVEVVSKRPAAVEPVAVLVTPAAPVESDVLPAPVLVLDTLLPADVVPLEVAEPQAAAILESAAAENGTGEAVAGGQLEFALVCETEPLSLMSVEPEPPVAEWPVETLPVAEVTEVPLAEIPVEALTEMPVAEEQVVEPVVFAAAIEEVGPMPPSSVVADEVEPEPQAVTASVVADEVEPEPQAVTASVVADEVEPEPQAVTASVEADEVEPVPQAATASVEADEVEPAAPSSQGPVHLEIVESPARQVPPAQEPAAFDLAQLELASMGLPSLRKALLSAFLSEISPFLEKLSWTLSDEDAQRVSSEAHALAVLSSSVGATACAEALQELERRGADGTLRASDTILRRCYGQGLGAATEVRALLAEERRAA